MGSALRANPESAFRRSQGASQSRADINELLVYLSRCGYARDLYTRESSEHRGVLQHPAAPPGTPAPRLGLDSILIPTSKVQRPPQGPADHASPAGFQIAPATTTATKTFPGAARKPRLSALCLSQCLFTPEKLKTDKPS